MRQKDSQSLWEKTPSHHPPRGGGTALTKQQGGCAASQEISSSSSTAASPSASIWRRSSWAREAVIHIPVLCHFPKEVTPPHKCVVKMGNHFPAQSVDSLMVGLNWTASYWQLQKDFHILKRISSFWIGNRNWDPARQEKFASHGILFFFREGGPL